MSLHAVPSPEPGSALSALRIVVERQEGAHLAFERTDRNRWEMLRDGSFAGYVGTAGMLRLIEEATEGDG